MASLLLRSSSYVYGCSPRLDRRLGKCYSPRLDETMLFMCESNSKFSISGLKFSGLQLRLKEPIFSSSKILAKASESSLGSDEPLEQDDNLEISTLVGEDAAVFNLSNQKISSWISFSVILGVVLTILNYIWIDPRTGYGNAFITTMSSISENHEVVMLCILLVFALVHSGLASFRDLGEKLIGERAFRVLFAGISLPLAVSAVVYFIDHRYDGVQLWQIQGIPGAHELVWLMSFISFFFLYPSTFNLLEVAAVDKPKMHMYETGIMRITRHPQMVGQFLWCIAHTLWVGNSFMLTTSFGLLAHHLYGVWNGDRRLAIRYGKAFEVVKNRTSIVPFAAILDGRQKLPEDYYKEFFRVPYFTILALTLGAYFAHPLLQAGSYHLNW
ncbi:hypothetical protein KP509_23G049900 [Ceratopteris richardii]|uniref:NnrU domain-containing protein n=2 Tax=Ceratopteris richardii TaxID=49495 RepID=A0A8T2S2S6_CERRI|nr:hypothetical protein KP509_23G049900 [Ceratopteris richardii]